MDGWGVTTFFPITNGSIIEIHQDGDEVAFIAEAYYFAFTPKYRDAIFKGTFKDFKLKAACPNKTARGKWEITAYLENLDKIYGTIRGTAGQSKFILTRLDTIVDLSKYRNVRNLDTKKAGAATCFIATAAYGSPFERHVMTLRQFREKWLLTNLPGKLFVRAYYRLSPPIADAIAGRLWARSIVRIGLMPAVICAGAAMGNPFYICVLIFFFMGTVFSVFICRNRFKRRAK